MQLNEVQLKAVNYDGNKNTLVFASAGAGKTTVLVSRLIKRITQNMIPLSKIVAVTFTDAAALNMKNRLRTALLEKIAEVSDDQRPYLENQLAEVENSNISTIHSFCLRILQEYYYLVDLNLKSVNTVIDSALSKLAKDAILDDLIHACLQSDPEGLYALSDNLSSELFSFGILKKSILKVYNTCINQVDPLAWLNDQIIEKEICSSDDIDREVMTVYHDEIKDILNEISSEYEKIARIENIDNSESYLAKALEIREIMKINDHRELSESLKTALTPLTDIRKNDEYKKHKNLIAKLSSEIADLLIDEKTIVKTENLIKPLNNLLIELVKGLYFGFQEYKKREGLIDFNDIEHFAYRILTANDNKIAQELKKRYREVMIDEFQDTNNIQYAIMSLISDNDLFLVGDIKQSIYGFRGARPQIMEELKAKPDYNIIHIKENYRSKANLVAFNNELFAKLMNIDGNGFKKEDEQIAPLSLQKSQNHPIVFKLLSIPKDERIDVKSAKAELLIKAIVDVHKEGTPFKDICVLVRTHGDKIPLKKAFDQYNIPYYMKEREGYFSSFAIEILLSYLKLMIDPFDKVALVSVLSGLYGYSDDDLLLIDIEDANTIKDDLFKKDYSALKEFTKENDLSGFLTYFIRINDFYEHVLDTKEKANLDLLISKLSTYGVFSISQLADYIEKVSEDQDEVAFDLSEDADVVRVMTIHQSKGLQFNTVILFSQNENRQKAQDALLTDQYLGIGFKIYEAPYRLGLESVRRKAIKIKDNYEDLAEYERLLYVALTRAEEKLVIVDAYKKENETFFLNKSFLKARKGFTSYLYGIMKDSELVKLEISERLESIEPLKGEESSKPLKEKYRYHQKQTTKMRPSDHGTIKLELEKNYGTQYGTDIHKLLETIDLKKANSDDLHLLNDGISDDILAKIKRFRDDPLTKSFSDSRIFKEYPFYYDDGEKRIEGVMDLMVESDDKIVVVDYKTDKLNSDKEFIERYHDQITIYKRVLKEAFDREVYGYIYSFYLSKYIMISD